MRDMEYAVPAMGEPDVATGTQVRGEKLEDGTWVVYVWKNGTPIGSTGATIYEALDKAIVFESMRQGN